MQKDSIMKFNATPTRYKVKSLVEIPKGLYFRPENPKQFASVARDVTDGWMVMKAQGFMFKKGMELDLAEDAPEKLGEKLSQFEKLQDISKEAPKGTAQRRQGST